TPPDQRLIVGIAGIPASGKSTISHRLVTKLNALLSKHEEHATMRAIFVGLDGWHYSRATLDTFPDPKLAHERRGAHWTFDGEGYAAFFKTLRAKIDENTGPISFPTFAHHIKDPAPSPNPITREHRLIIIEGLHLLLSLPPWKEPAELLDERWLVEVDQEQARQRLVKRHVETGICLTEEDAQYRWESNDHPNGQHTLENMVSPTMVISNLDEVLESPQ
ncbi:P-loop containing nucleoside triphosphate hydrolase protein, partial [Panaeolus papilionaceus]